MIEILKDLVTSENLIILGIGVAVGVVIGGVFVYTRYRKVKRAIAEINRFHGRIEEVANKSIDRGKDVQKDIHNIINDMKKTDLW